jgi:hypothetical protein
MERNEKLHLYLESIVKNSNEKIELSNTNVMNLLQSYDARIIDIRTDVQYNQEFMDTKLKAVDDTSIVKRWVETKLNSLS